jgi:hypothetical protein
MRWKLVNEMEDLLRSASIEDIRPRPTPTSKTRTSTCYSFNQYQNHGTPHSKQKCQTGSVPTSTASRALRTRQNSFLCMATKPTSPCGWSTFPHTTSHITMPSKFKDHERLDPLGVRPPGYRQVGQRRVSLVERTLRQIPRW